MSLATCAAVTERIGLSTAVRLPVESDPISLAKALATLDHLSGGRVTIGAGFGWNTDELTDHHVPAASAARCSRSTSRRCGRSGPRRRRRTTASSCRSAPSWAYPKPPQGRIPVIIGAGAGPKTIEWIARNADGWMTTGSTDVAARAELLRKAWADAGREGEPDVRILVAKRPTRGGLRGLGGCRCVRADLGCPRRGRGPGARLSRQDGRPLGVVRSMTPLTGRSRYAELSRADLAVLVPELLLMGQLIDRSGMAWCISASAARRCCRSRSRSGRPPARSTPAGCSTRWAMRRLHPGQGDVVTIFKGLQLDIGAPPQFMDFRYTVHDPRHGEFQLDHCGALMDVEPMGPDYVKGMCHDIEDPTFDATAIASHPKAQVRPIHRPPRSTEDMGADRSPHCAWTVIIDDSYPEAQGIPALVVNQRSRAATIELAPTDPVTRARPTTPPRWSATSTSLPSPTPRWSDRGRGLPPDAPSRPAFALALEKRCESEEQLTRIRRQQLTGAAGVGALPDCPRARHQPGRGGRASAARAPPAAQPGGGR